MAALPALSRKCHFATALCEQLLTQTAPQESTHLQHENMLRYTQCYVILHYHQLLDTYIRSSIFCM